MNEKKRQNGSGLFLVMALVVILVLVLGLVWFRHQAQKTPAIPPVSDQPATTLNSGSGVYSLTVDGTTRTYRVYKPAGLSGIVPLVLMLHGGGGSGQVAERFYGWDQQADKEKFVVAYPDGLGPRTPAWNTEGGNCCGYPEREHIDDVGFIKAMVAKIESGATIDTNRVYATGISNGGIMAYTLACQTNLFAAIGPDSATQLDSSCQQPSPISVIHIHGLKDTTIPFDGSPGQGPGNIDGPPVPEIIANWRRIDDCSPPTSRTSGVVVTEAAACPDGRAVELITIADGGHGWPGSPAKSASSTSGGVEPSQALDATSVIWQFFAAHPRHG